MHKLRIERACKFRARNARVCRHGPHRQFVTKANGVRSAHAGQIQMLAGHRGGHHIELIDADDAVNRPRTGEIRYCPHIIERARVVLNRLRVVYRSPRPRRVEQLPLSHQRHKPAGGLSFLEKLIPLKFAGDANDVVWHSPERAAFSSNGSV